MFKMIFKRVERQAKAVVAKGKKKSTKFSKSENSSLTWWSMLMLEAVS